MLCTAVCDAGPQCVPKGLFVLTDPPCCSVTQTCDGRGVLGRGRKGPEIPVWQLQMLLLFKVLFPRLLPTFLRNGEDMLVFHIRACHTRKKPASGSSCPSVALQHLGRRIGLAFQLQHGMGITGLPSSV